MKDTETSGDVIDQNDETSGDVIDQNQEPTNDVIEQEGDTSEEQPEPQQTETEPTRDDFYKNKSYELQRKLDNLADNLPSIVEDAVNKTKPKEQAYTIEQLEAFAIQNPEHRPWVESEKSKIRDAKVADIVDKRLQEERTQLRNDQIKQQSEAAVYNDPRFDEAFITLPNGQKQWNQNSKLTQLIGAYMNEPRLKGQPDGLLIAARLARADLLDSQTPQAVQKLNSIKRENASLKKQTLVEGAGTNVQQPQKDKYREATERLSKTGRIEDARLAVKEFLNRKHSRSE